MTSLLREVLEDETRKRVSMYKPTKEEEQEWWSETERCIMAEIKRELGVERFEALGPQAAEAEYEARRITEREAAKAAKAAGTYVEPPRPPPKEDEPADTRPFRVSPVALAVAVATRLYATHKIKRFVHSAPRVTSAEADPVASVATRVALGGPKFGLARLPLAAVLSTDEELRASVEALVPEGRFQVGWVEPAKRFLGSFSVKDAVGMFGDMPLAGISRITAVDLAERFDALRVEDLVKDADGLVPLVITFPVWLFQAENEIEAMVCDILDYALPPLINYACSLKPEQKPLPKQLIVEYAAHLFGTTRLEQQLRLYVRVYHPNQRPAGVPIETVAVSSDARPILNNHKARAAAAQLLQGVTPELFKARFGDAVVPPETHPSSSHYLITAEGKAVVQPAPVDNAVVAATPVEPASAADNAVDGPVTPAAPVPDGPKTTETQEAADNEAGGNAVAESQ